MNRIATAALAVVLVAGGSFGAWRVGRLGTHYAQVVRATPVTVREPRYADVVDAVPLPAGGGRRSRMKPRTWDVAYRVGNRVLRTRVAGEPGDQVRIGDQRRIIGYDVVWRWRDRTGVARMSARPGRLLPVVDGAVVETRRPTPLAGS